MQYTCTMLQIKVSIYLHGINLAGPMHLHANLTTACSHLWICLCIHVCMSQLYGQTEVKVLYTMYVTVGLWSDLLGDL